MAWKQYHCTWRFLSPLPTIALEDKRVCFLYTSANCNGTGHIHGIIVIELLYDVYAKEFVM
jgi:hypothetical protein